MVRAQSYPHWHLYYIDDASDDGQYEVIQEWIISHQLEDKVTLIRNTTRLGHMHNQYHAIHTCTPETVVVINDGDDFLAHTDVLAHLAAIYEKAEVWLTWGQYWYLKRNKRGICTPVPKEILRDGKIRSFYPWVTSHLRTFRAGLYHAIFEEDLKENGQWLARAVDVATMFAMIDMARTHVEFIPEVLLMYNDLNSLSFANNTAMRDDQRRIEKLLREQTPYEPLREKPW
jgi:glycosyltransferase involved in cell wall biosynthesis